MQSWQTCALSGELIETPVISKVSGHIYEKRLIEKHIESTGTCPITGRPLNLEDLIEVKVAKVQKPRPVTATSIPSLLSLLQNEWDALLLEQFQLKQHLEQVRHELTHALYQHDAACRVIQKLYFYLLNILYRYKSNCIADFNIIFVFFLKLIQSAFFSLYISKSQFQIYFQINQIQILKIIFWFRCFLAIKILLQKLMQFYSISEH